MHNIKQNDTISVSTKVTVFGAIIGTLLECYILKNTDYNLVWSFFIVFGMSTVLGTLSVIAGERFKGRHRFNIPYWLSPKALFKKWVYDSIDDHYVATSVVLEFYSEETLVGKTSFYRETPHKDQILMLGDDSKMSGRLFKVDHVESCEFGYVVRVYGNVLPTTGQQQ